MIELLKLQRLGIPKTSGFGDDNHGSIDAQVSALTRALKQDEDEIRTATDAAYDCGNESAANVLGWVLGEQEPPVEEDDQWVKKGLLKLKATLKDKAAR